MFFKLLNKLLELLQHSAAQCSTVLYCHDLELQSTEYLFRPAFHSQTTGSQKIKLIKQTLLNTLWHEVKKGGAVESKQNAACTQSAIFLIFLPTRKKWPSCKMQMKKNAKNSKYKQAYQTSLESWRIPRTGSVLKQFLRRLKPKKCIKYWRR